MSEVHIVEKSHDKSSISESNAVEVKKDVPKKTAPAEKKSVGIDQKPGKAGLPSSSHSSEAKEKAVKPSSKDRSRAEKKSGPKNMDCSLEES